VATATLARMSVPSIPKSANGSAVRPSVSSAPAKTGCSQRVIIESPNGRPSARPSSIDGIASRISGSVIVHVDSWIFGSTAGSTWLSP
jgi:hypothetical protein